MHANADHRISLQGIVERGGWNLTRVSKAFSYILNTSAEDQQVARQLSGWDPAQLATLPGLSCLDEHVRSRVARVQATLFSASTGLSTPSGNLDRKVLDVYMAAVLLHYPGMTSHGANSLYERRVHDALRENDVQQSEILGWSAHVRSTFSSATAAALMDGGVETTPDVVARLDGIARQIDQLLTSQRRLEEQLAALEAHFSQPVSQPPDRDVHDATASLTHAPQVKRLRKQAPRTLTSAWWIDMQRTLARTQRTCQERVCTGALVILIDAHQARLLSDEIVDPTPDAAWLPFICRNC